MDRKEIVELLNINFRHELEATMMYTYNSFIIEDCDISRLTEAIAADEMRHMWWLADLITKRGGKPSMELGEVEYAGEDIRDGLEKQIQKETEGIEEYERQIEIIDDDEVTGVLRHIIDEEKRHRKEFRERLERLL
ncbi:ferritin-like domain-containing protein [Methanothermobacter sp.]|uniref:ferritin-like domain-containing protein n=1 Tax=Methanothermobacter sp. TaxID=1884223 RepID=UPI003C76D6B4